MVAIQWVRSARNFILLTRTQSKAYRNDMGFIGALLALVFLAKVIVKIHVIKLSTRLSSMTTAPVHRTFYRQRQKGITGLETAIILISFVVVASVFACTVLAAGLFASQRSEETVHNGINSITTLRTTGDLIGRALDITLDDCEDAWVDDTGGSVTCDTSTTYYKENAKSISMAIDSGWAGGTVAVPALAAHLDLSSHGGPFNITTASKLQAWVRYTATPAAGVLQLRLDDTATCLSSLEELVIPSLDTNQWTRCEWNLSNPAALSTVLAVGLYATGDPGSLTIYLDDIEIVPYCYKLEVTVSNALRGWDTDLTPPYQLVTTSHGELSPTNTDGVTRISYSDKNNYIEGCAWTLEFIGRHSDDFTLSDSEFAKLTIWFVNYEWDSTNSMMYYDLGASDEPFVQNRNYVLRNNQELKISITPPTGATYFVAGTTPPQITSVMDLDNG